MSPPASLLRLMEYRALSRSFRLGPEDAMAVEFANDLRKATLEGRLRAVWTHVGNELCGQVQITRSGPRATPAAAKAKALGLIRGASDYLFLWSEGCCALEAKSRTGCLNDWQRDFRDWCAANGVPFDVFRMVEEGLSILQRHGILEPAT